MNDELKDEDLDETTSLPKGAEEEEEDEEDEWSEPEESEPQG